MDIQQLKDCLPKLSGKDFEFASSLISALARWGGLTWQGRVYPAPPLYWRTHAIPRALSCAGYN